MAEIRRGQLTQRFGAVMREQRTAAGYSQEKLAHEAGVDRSFVSEIERGVKSPTLETLALLAAALNVTPSELLRRAEKFDEDASE